MALAARVPQPRDPRRKSRVAAPDPSLSLVRSTAAHRGPTRAIVWVASFFAVLAAVVALRTHVAQQQILLDSLNRDVAMARDHFDSLRAERARLRSPAVLTEAARAIGMSLAPPGRRIISIPPEVAADVAAKVGVVDGDVIEAEDSALAEYGRIKARVGPG